jgi:hypothetical protein
MASAAAPVTPPRTARVGDRLPSAVLGPRPARRLDATAVLLPGGGSVAEYAAGLAARADDFAAWDGVVVTLERAGDGPHRLLVVDRYRQVYAVHEADSPSDLPNADELEEWFRFLATACPECGVIDDPMLSGPTL